MGALRPENRSTGNKNVYNDPAYTSIKKNLHKRLLKLMKKYGDSEELAKSFLPN